MYLLQRDMVPSKSSVGFAVLIICISSYDAVYLNRFLQSDIFNRFNIMERMRFVVDKKTDDQMDGQTDKQKNIYLFSFQEIGDLKQASPVKPPPPPQ